MIEPYKSKESVCISDRMFRFWKIGQMIVLSLFILLLGFCIYLYRENKSLKVDRLAFDQHLVSCESSLKHYEENSLTCGLPSKTLNILKNSDGYSGAPSNNIETPMTVAIDTPQVRFSQIHTQKNLIDFDLVVKEPRMPGTPPLEGGVVILCQNDRGDVVIPKRARRAWRDGDYKKLSRLGLTFRVRHARRFSTQLSKCQESSFYLMAFDGSGLLIGRYAHVNKGNL